MAHHGSNPDQERELNDAIRRMEQRIFGEFPDGRLGPDDNGAVAVAIGHREGRVVMQFPRNLNWIGFTADQAIDIANSLIEHARTCGSTKPLTVKIG